MKRQKRISAVFIELNDHNGRPVNGKCACVVSGDTFHIKEKLKSYAYAAEWNGREWICHIDSIWRLNRFGDMLRQHGAALFDLGVAVKCLTTSAGRD